MAVAAAPLSKGLMGNGLYQSFVVGAVGIVALFARNLIHRERPVRSLDLSRRKIVAGSADAGCRGF